VSLTPEADNLRKRKEVGPDRHNTGWGVGGGGCLSSGKRGPHDGGSVFKGGAKKITTRRNPAGREPL